MLKHLIVIVAAMFGFVAAYYIARQKSRGEKMVCPLDANCEAVVHSDYSRLVGIPLEYLGLFYYGLTFLIHVLFLFLPAWSEGYYPLGLKLVSGGAFIFSVYLIWVQFMRLKNWCFWCLMSSFSTLVVFVSSFFLH